MDIEQQKLRSGRGQGCRSWRLAAALILAIGAILPVRALAGPSPAGRARGKAESAALGSRQAPSLDAMLTLRVYDYARVDPGLLSRAEKVADAIFAESGIGIAWMDCTPPREELLPNATCPSDMGASDLVLRLLPRRMAMRLAAPNEPLGFAQQCPEAEPACELTLFYFRVEELAADEHRPELILGHVIAHEVGHVLIGPGHSEDGVMRREWSREELRRISLGLQLSFSSVQSGRLRDAVLRRIKQPVPEISTRAALVAGQSQVRK